MPREGARSADVIVIGTVQRDGGAWHIAPEAFLKGPATERRIPLDDRPSEDCEPAELGEGQRLLVALYSDAPGDAAYWPAEGQTFLLSGSEATGNGATLAEHELVSSIRAVTGQYAVPAADSGSGIHFDFGGNIVPVAIALAFLLGVGLVLMRLWHAIDPS